MSTLEQVKLLETKVAKAIDYVNHLSGENTMLREKLNGYQTRIDELEVLIMQFKEDQGKVESGILSALDRLNQFEDAIEKGISHISKERLNTPSEIPILSVKKEELAVSVEAESIIPSIEEDVSLSADLVSDKFESNDKALADTLFSETSPAEDSDSASSDAEIASDEASIMAALEAEENAAKAKASAVQTETSKDAASQGDASPEAELDIF